MLTIKQLLVDVYGCSCDLNDGDQLLKILEDASNAVGSHIVRRVVQRFEPVGVSVILILAETHMSIHTWPEHNYAAVDVFFCSEGKDPYIAWESIRVKLNPKSYELKELTRCIGEKRV